MPTLSLHVTSNAAEMAQSFMQLGYGVPPTIQRQLENTGMRVIARMQQYPTPPPMSQYVRTYGFQTSWRFEPYPYGVRIINRATQRGREYPKFVVGSAYGTEQAYMHVGRWPLFRDVTEEMVGALPDDISTQIKLVARRYNLVIT